MSLIWRIGKWLAVVWLLMVAVGFCSAAFAQALPQVFPQSVSGNVTTFASTTATASNASSFTFGAAANGPIYATSQQSVSIGSGRTVTATVKAFPDALATSKAIGRFALKVATPLVVGVALYDLAEELGFTATNNPSGSGVSFTRTGVQETFSYQCWDGEPSSNGLDCAARLQALWRGIGYPNCVITATGWGGSTRYYNGKPYSSGLMSEATACGNNQSPAGRTKTGEEPVSTPVSVEEFEGAVRARIPLVPSGSALPRAVGDAVASGEPLPLPKPAEITGPPSVTLPPEVVTSPDGSKVTTTPKKELSYGPDSVTVTDTSTKVFTDSTGDTTGTSTTTKPAEVPDIKTCGYPGGPPCKIDEAGTPEAKADEAYKQKADDYKKQVDDDRAVIQGSTDKQFFTGWNVFFSAPPIAACEPIALPDYNGASMGQINPCGTAGAIRQVMAWLWALGGLWLCLGWVREVV